MTNDDIVERCFASPNEGLSSLSQAGFEASRRALGNTMRFYVPGMVHYETEYHSMSNKLRFPGLSTTGRACALNCDHCSGQLLISMHPTTSPEALWKHGLKVYKHGGSGILVSGGSTHLGNTPLLPFIPVLKRIKQDLGLHIVVHTGLVLPEIAEALGEVGIDGAMLDIIGSDDTLREVYHLDMSTDVFDESMSLLEENNIPFMPHVIAGLHYGRLEGEIRAIRMIAKHNPEVVVVVAFMPLDNTPMEHVAPSTPEDITRVILAARLAMPRIPLTLGCARPLGNHRRTTDRLAIDSGVNGIAYPTPETHEYAVEKGLDVIYEDECCSLIGRAFHLETNR